MGPGRVVALLGPTGTGKTAVAVEVAGLIGAAVISCDSMQVYQGFPVLTNQPSALEFAVAPHELVGCIEPGEPFSAAQYAASARPLLARSVRERGWALIAGGTGLYMRAALAPLAMSGQAGPDLRRSLEARLRSEGPDALHTELAELDPAAAQAIDPRNPRRVLRALEAVTATGRGWSGRSDLWEPAYDHPTTVVVLALDRRELYARINARAALIVAEGAVEEVRRFRESVGPARSRPGSPGICSAIGYPEICRYLEGAESLEEAVGQVAAATRRYARRQLTWLSKVRDAVIIDVHDKPPQRTAEEILAAAKAAERTKESF